MPPVVAMAFFCACNSQGPAPSGMLQVVVASDPSVANELDHVDLQATQSGAVLLTVDEDVGPTGISLPASYEVRAAASNAAVAIHLVASHAGVAVLVRDAVTPVPSGVTVDVHLVLDSACLGSEEPRLDGGVASACADGLTCVQGACVSVVVPVGSLAGGSDASIATSDGSSTGRPDGASPNAACNGFDCFPSASGAMGSPLEGACTGSGTEACDGEPCGIQTRTCANGTWSDWGRCTRQGVCAPGDMQACGTNGVQTCGADCEWAAACGCPSGQTACTAGTCTTLASDVHDCGACGMDCALLPHVAGGSAACVAAVCTYACTSGYADCAGGGGGCTTSLASVSNCGGCGIPCSAASPVCAPAADASTGASNGGYACATGCTASAPTLCNGSCVNLQSSDANCGGCGKACASGVTCQAGVCVCTGASSEPCGNCGTETRTCNGDGSWSTWSACTGQGTCVPNATQTCDGNGSQTCTAACGWSSCTCNPGYTLCNGVCVNEAADDANCGGCGKACASGVTCQAGVCACTGASSEACGNCGTETRTCNGDGSWSTWSACTGQGTCVPNATQTCEGNGSQTCTAACGWGDCVCNADYTFCNGACVSETSDPNNCGGCGIVCPGNCVNASCNPTEVAAVTAGAGHTCVLVTGNLPECWGYNVDGELGNGTTALSSPMPTAVFSPAEGGIAVAQFAAGGDHTCDFTVPGVLQCWGADPYGELGNGDTTGSDVPYAGAGLTNVTQLALGTDNSCALLTDGSVQCWGRNDFGQLGIGSFSGPTTCSGTACATSPVAVSGLSGVTQIAAGGDYECARLSNSTVQCWGYNGYATLGNGTVSNSAVPVAVTGLTDVVAVATGGDHACALLATGSVECWGDNSVGELGNGSTANSLTPVLVSGISNAVALTAGGYHTCALLSDTSVVCWGYNDYGQLGDGTFSGPDTCSGDSCATTPTPVSGLTRVLAMASGSYHTCAIVGSCGDCGGGAGSPTVQCWGLNSDGQLGNGSTTASNVPVSVVW